MSSTAICCIQYMPWQIVTGVCMYACAFVHPYLKHLPSTCLCRWMHEGLRDSPCHGFEICPVALPLNSCALSFKAFSHLLLSFLLRHIWLLLPVSLLPLIWFSLMIPVKELECVSWRRLRGPVSGHLSNLGISFSSKVLIFKKTES